MSLSSLTEPEAEYQPECKGAGAQEEIFATRNLWGPGNFQTDLKKLKDQALEVNVRNYKNSQVQHLPGIQCASNI